MRRSWFPGEKRAASQSVATPCIAPHRTSAPVSRSAGGWPTSRKTSTIELEGVPQRAGRVVGRERRPDRQTEHRLVRSRVSRGEVEVRRDERAQALGTGHVRGVRQCDERRRELVEADECYSRDDLGPALGKWP